ncbi:pyridoxal phosphate-dependent aminotransferase [Terriglobus saanensis]|uniref:Aminotransferase class I and II n=1 Tax=Terriglobus saanensis (strain ATCC BAA-1853 / DSM 23119 / SP1PR4) TaxID=401053 RepID=E8V8F0_TERSS|nr:pyridoxal phosphate-dependent aminotransferase [Terriglobus saanensis]ADV82929.1 aminotransferase class I and II [Terriglobus saanensis SP1PR4]
MSTGSCNPSVSRRNFVRLFGAGAAAAAAISGLTPELRAQAAEPSPFTPRTKRMERPQLPPDAVIISTNENPLGPAHSAMEYMMKIAPMGGRYDRVGVGQDVVKTLSEQFGLKPGYVEFYPGSGGPLDMALMSNIGPDKGLVCADPSYEQGPRAAKTMKAPLKMVPLTATYAHDVKAMLAANPNAGAFYIVNPNNPTGTMTPKEDILWLIQNKPAGSVVIVDEAYHHFSTHESVIDQVAADKDVIVMRTFSKIYGMAGIRAGFAIARPDLLAKFNTVSPYLHIQNVASASMMSAAMAVASLKDADLVPLRRKLNRDNLDMSMEFLDKHGYKTIPGSQANMFMVDVKRPGSDFTKQMLTEKVAIGRSWPIMPTYVRVTVGTKDEMLKFQTAFVKCMDKPSTTVNAQLKAELYIPSEIDRHYV